MCLPHLLFQRMFPRAGHSLTCIHTHTTLPFGVSVPEEVLPTASPFSLSCLFRSFTQNKAWLCFRQRLAALLCFPLACWLHCAIENALLFYCISPAVRDWHVSSGSLKEARLEREGSNMESQLAGTARGTGAHAPSILGTFWGGSGAWVEFEFFFPGDQVSEIKSNLFPVFPV